MRMEKVSLIIPMYNLQDVIKHSLDAVLEQNYKNVELIIVDDGSIDKSVSVAENYLNGKDIDYRIICQQNKGVSAARNLGIRVSTGDWIMCLDGDDYIVPVCLVIINQWIKIR